MNAHQRQRLANAGFTKQDIDILDIDALPVRKHDYAINLAIAMRKSLPGIIERHFARADRPRLLTQAEIRALQQRQKSVLTLDDDRLPFSDTELKAAVADGIRDTVRSALNTIRGRVD